MPTTTFSTLEPPSRSARSTETQIHARTLRKLLEDLEDLELNRGNIVSQAKRLAATDDIKPRISRAAAAKGHVERDDGQWKEVDPAKFEDVIEQGMRKFEGFADEVQESGDKLDALLKQITARIPILCSLNKCLCF